MIDDTCAHIYALTQKLANVFAASAGTINDPLQILRDHKIIEKQSKYDSRLGRWWLFRFVENVPEINQDPKTLWDSQKRILRQTSSLSHTQTLIKQEEKDKLVSHAQELNVDHDIRAFAVYHFLANCFQDSAYPDFELINETRGRVSGLHTILEKVFTANLGAVDRTITVLQRHGILQRDDGAKISRKLVWIFYFSTHVPPLPNGKSVEDLWHSRDKMRGRSFGVSETVLSPEHIKEVVAPLMHESLVHSSDSFKEQKRLFDKLREELRENAREMVMQACNDAHQGITRIMEDVRGVLSIQDIDRINALLTQLDSFGFQTHVGFLNASRFLDELKNKRAKKKEQHDEHVRF